MKNQITIHRALSQLKTIEGRVSDLLNQQTFIDTYQGDGRKIKGIAKEDKIASIQSGYDSIIDLLSLQDRIKSQIALSNATKQVIVAGETMTVAEAISRKHTSALKYAFLETLQRQFRQAQSVVNKGNEKAIEIANKSIVDTFASSEKLSTEEVENYRKAVMKANEFNMLDPLNLERKIKTLQDSLDEFSEEVDAVLSESNATTFIEI